MKNAKILIVEDEAIIAMEIESNLKSLGYDVVASSDSGEDAIEKSDSLRPDIILMDIRLKGKIDGIEAADKIRSRFEIPIIFLTAYLNESRLERAKPAMPFGYILKPVQERDLKVTLEMALYTSKVDAERRKAESKLKVQEEKYRLLYEKAPSGYQSLDEKGTIIEVNDAWLSTLGYSKDEVLGKSFGDFLHPEWVDDFKHKFPSFKKMGGISGVELSIRRKDGSCIMVSIDGWIERDEKGEFKQTNCILRDVTESHRYKETLRLNKDRLESLLDLNQMISASEDKIMHFALEEAVRLTDSDGGYLHFFDEDKEDLSLFLWSDSVMKKCDAEKDPHYPLEHAGIWADCIRQRKPVVHNDYPNEPFKKGLPDGHFDLKRHVSVPVIEEGKIVAVLGVGNKDQDYNDLDVDQLGLFSNSMWGILKRKRATNELRKSEEKFRVIIENSKGVIFMINKDGYFVLSEGAALSGLGLEPGQVVGMDAYEIYKEYPAIINALDRALKGETVHDPHLVVQGIRDKRHFDIFYSPNTVDGELVGIVGEAIDITERVKADAERMESEERYRTLFERSSDAIFIFEKETGRYVDANAAGERLTGRPVTELRTLTTHDVTKQQAQEKLDMVSLSKKPIDFGEIIYFRPDGTERIALLVVIPFSDQLIFGIARDITELKKSQELMIQTEKMMSVGGLAAGMAHEINNPLGAMLQGIQNILRRLSPDLDSNLEPAKESGIDLNNLQSYLKKREILYALNGIQESGKKAAHIISNMLQFSRKSESKRAPTNLVILLENVLELADKDYDLKKKYDFRNIEIVKEFDSDLPLVLCTETEIEQVVLNILKNAAQAMIEESQKGFHRIIIRLLNHGNVARIEVEDNGPGMNEETRKRIFEPFFTTKNVGEGTGLGLSVSYMIITNNHQGTLEVESELGKGTKFIIRLPLDRKDP